MDVYSHFDMIERCWYLRYRILVFLYFLWQKETLNVHSLFAIRSSFFVLVKRKLSIFSFRQFNNSFLFKILISFSAKKNLHSFSFRQSGFMSSMIPSWYFPKIHSSKSIIIHTTFHRPDNFPVLSIKIAKVKNVIIVILYKLSIFVK